MDESAKPKKPSELEKSNEQLEKIRIELKKINDGNKPIQIINRGLLNGIATGIGATIGLAILLFFLAQVLNAFSDIPIINQLLTITKLGVIIETQPIQTDNSLYTTDNN